MIEIDGAIEHNAMMRPASGFFAPLAGTAFDVDTLAGVISLRLEGCAGMPRWEIPEGLPTPLLLICSGPAAPDVEDGIATPPGMPCFQVLFA
jgi:hypothetical protein